MDDNRVVCRTWYNGIIILEDFKTLSSPTFIYKGKGIHSVCKINNETVAVGFAEGREGREISIVNVKSKKETKRLTAATSEYVLSMISRKGLLFVKYSDPGVEVIDVDKDTLIHSYSHLGDQKEKGRGYINTQQLDAVEEGNTIRILAAVGGNWSNPKREVYELKVDLK